MCITPMWRREYQVNVPCGRCPVCMKKRVSSWSVRLLKEAEVSTSALFVTLTYDTQYVPITRNGWMTLQKTDLQNFFKRLRYYERKKNNPQTVKYYAVGEYGGKTSRPHYHAIIFNASEYGIADAWRSERGDEIGHIHYGKLTPASAGYTLKYISKKIKDRKPNDDRKDVFAIMSKGIGKWYTEDQRNIRWHISSLDDRYYIPAGAGVKASMPRYYRDRIYTPEQFGYLKGVLEKNANEKMEELHKEYSSYHIAQMHIQQFNKMQLITKNQDKL